MAHFVQYIVTGMECASCGAKIESAARYQSDQPFSTQRRQSGILVHVHSIPPNSVEAW